MRCGEALDVASRSSRNMKKVEEKKIRRRRRFRRFVQFTFWTNVIGLVFLIGFGVYAYQQYKPEYDKLRSSANEKINSIDAGTFRDKTETVVYNSENKVIKELAINDYYYIKNKDIQPAIKDSVLAIEDIRFYEHPGYDKKALTRAVVEMVKNKGNATQGGSTITQQLVKLQFLSLEKTYQRKIEEIMIATELEKMYSKDEILEFYLNNVNYGNGAYGIDTASRTYFSKPSKKLTVSEAAFLAGVPNNPSVYNPLRNMDNALGRRDVVLSQMKKYGMISKDQYEEAKAQKIKLKFNKRKVTKETYDVSFSISSATKELMAHDGFKFKYTFGTDKEREKYKQAYGDSFLEWNTKIRNGGFKIYTTINSTRQKQLQASVDAKLRKFWWRDEKSGIYKLQGSAVSIDNATGDVVAIVGGRSQDGNINTYNRAFLSARQPGSTIKPILSYVPAFERGNLATTRMVDSPIKKGPRNSNGQFLGAITLRKAVEISNNIIPYKIVGEYSPKTVLGYLDKMNFASIVPSDNNLSISIGGFTYGTNTLEMASAYSTIARNGEYIKPTGIRKIVDVAGDVVYENKHTKKRVYDSGASYLMTDVLKGVLKDPDGTGYGMELKNTVAAAKSGTTNDSKDVWFVGYSPYNTTAVWVGYDTPTPMPGVYGITYPGPIWKDYMDKIHTKFKKKKTKFKMPDDIGYAYVNPYNGAVDKKYDHGFWKRQLVPEIYIEYKERQARIAEMKRLKALKEAEKARKIAAKKEAERLRKLELARIKARKELLEKYDTNEEMLAAAKDVANSELQGLREYSITSKLDYDGAVNVLEDARKAIDGIAVPSERYPFEEVYRSQDARLKAEKYLIENPPKPKPVEKPVEDVEKPKEDVGVDPGNVDDKKDEVKVPVKKPEPKPTKDPVKKPEVKPTPKPTPKPKPSPKPDVKPVPKPTPKPTPVPKPTPDPVEDTDKEPSDGGSDVVDDPEDTN